MKSSFLRKKCKNWFDQNDISATDMIYHWLILTKKNRSKLLIQFHTWINKKIGRNWKAISQRRQSFKVEVTYSLAMKSKLSKVNLISSVAKYQVMKRYPLIKLMSTLPMIYWKIRSWVIHDSSLKFPNIEKGPINHSLECDRRGKIY